MRGPGDSHRVRSPADKPRDAEAMDAGVSETVDPQLQKQRDEAGVKPSKIKTPESKATTAAGDAI